MRQYLIGNITKFIDLNTGFNFCELEKIHYGLEALYMNITKIVVIIFISVLLKTLFGTILFLFFFNNLRMFSFGIHAQKSSQCWMFSLLFFVGIPYVSYLIIIPHYLRVLLYWFCLVCFGLYSPADTKNRPILNNEKRKRFKILTLIITTICFLLSFITNNNLCLNLMLFASLLETILILPVTYKLLAVPYANHLTYKGGD